MPTNGVLAKLMSSKFLYMQISWNTDRIQNRRIFSISLRPLFGPSRSTRCFFLLLRELAFWCCDRTLCPSRPLSKTVCIPPIKIQWENFRQSFRTHFAHSFRSPQAHSSLPEMTLYNKSKIRLTVLWNTADGGDGGLFPSNFSFCLSVLWNGDVQLAK